MTANAATVGSNQATFGAARKQSGFVAIGSIAGALDVLRNLSGGRRERHAPAVLRKFTSNPVAVEFVTAEGEAMTTHVCGSGRPMVLVHGLGGSHHDWDKVVGLLARHYRVYTLDARGHGARVDAGGRSPTLVDMARDLASLIDRLGLVRPVLVGHSMGALTVMQYLQDFGSAQLAGVCFVDQSPRIVTDASWHLGLFGSYTHSQHQAIVSRLKGNFVETIVGELAPRLSPRVRALCEGGRWAGRMLRRFLANIRIDRLLGVLECLGECDFRQVINGLSLPVLVVLGGCSNHYAGLPLAEYYEQHLTRGEIRTYPGAAHSPHKQEPVRFANDLLDFAARLAG